MTKIDVAYLEYCKNNPTQTVVYRDFEAGYQSAAPFNEKEIKCCNQRDVNGDCMYPNCGGFELNNHQTKQSLIKNNKNDCDTKH